MVSRRKPPVKYFCQFVCFRHSKNDCRLQLRQQCGLYWVARFCLAKRPIRFGSAKLVDFFDLSRFERKFFRKLSVSLFKSSRLRLKRAAKVRWSFLVLQVVWKIFFQTVCGAGTRGKTRLRLVKFRTQKYFLVASSSYIYIQRHGR